MAAIKKTFQFGEHAVSLETGEIARQADGAVMVDMADTVVLVTVVASKRADPGRDFFPLTIDYQEKAFAAGRIPGGFFRREGRPSETEILTARLCDRPVRPLFPKGFTNEVQVIATVLSVERSQFGRRKYTPAEVLSTARTITIIAGLAIAAAAYGLSFMPSRWGIVDAMPRTFNAVTGPLGGLFLVGMLLPRVGEAAAVIGACCGFAVAVGIGYSVEISRVIQQAGWLPEAWAWLTDTTLSFTWVMPAAVGTTLAVSALLGLAWPRESQSD